MEIVPFLVKLEGEPTAISSGGYYSACLMKDGTIFSFGSNKHNRAGHPGSEDTILVPRRIPGIKDITMIACGDWHMMALASNGKCYGIGYNKQGALAIGTTTDCANFEVVQYKDPIKAVFAGQNYSMFLDPSNKLLSTGNGKLHGNHSTENIIVPTLVF